MIYDILAIVCIHLPCVSESMYVCMYVRHDIQIPCTRDYSLRGNKQSLFL